MSITQYPGDTAAPETVAAYFYYVAKSEYQLPGILPVQTSCVELSDAWTGPGDVKQVSGYLNPVDHWSVGYFQQQYDGNPDGTFFGWGTYNQLIDAEYALHRFCQEAVKFKDWEWHADTSDPEVLGRWCQAVQRSAFPDAYRTKGYPMARDLLANIEEETVDWNERILVVSGNNWLYDEESDQWVRFRIDSGSERDLRTGDTIEVTNAGWPAVKRKSVVPVETNRWPVANDDPIPGSWNYQERHPTRYFWRPDVEEWAAYLVDNYSVWCNTYWEHPEGWGWEIASVDPDGTTWYNENTSLDVWGPAGRNDYLDPNVGDTIFNLLFHYKGKPDINWIIYKRVLYSAANGWNGIGFGTDDFSWHDDHIHVTYH
jgi:hypothetical protein